MSKLFDDSSLAMIPTAVKDGKLYSIRPTPEYGAELVTNGSFDSDSNWTKGSGWTISGGKANASSATSDFTQTISYTLGKTYRITYTISNYSSGSVRTLLGAYISGTTRSSNGTFIEDITPTNSSSNSLFYLEGISGFSGSIDNVSVQEITKSGDFTFSRGSNLAATRVDVNGLIEKGRENLLLQSNQFDTTWFNTNTTETGGQSGYDGSSDAWLLDITGGASSQYIGQNISTSGVNTFSVYAKAGTKNWIMFLGTGGTIPQVYFDLENGLVGTQSSATGSIISVGNGWYRCSMFYNLPIGSIRIYMATADNDITQSSGNLYIQDAQLEQGLVATDYIETGASTAQAGILEDMPRLDYSGGASCPALLLEPQRSNLVPQSEYFNASDYTFDAITATANATISPDGLNNATQITRTSSSGNARLILGNRVVSSGAKVAISIFAKANTASDIILYNTISTQGKRFNLSTGIAGDDFVSAPDDYGIEDYGNGWYRCHIVVTAPSTLMNSWIYIPEASTSSVYMYGQQMEEGSYPTSYIPTYGSSVTRSLDSCQRTGATDLLGQEQGVVFLDFTYKPVFDDAAGQSTYRFSISNNTYTNRVIIYPNNSNQLNILANGVVFTGSAYSLTEGQRYKVALAYGETSVCYINGVQAFGYGSGTPVGGYSQIQFSDAINASTRTWTSPVHQALIFPTRLTNAELAALTTI